MELPKFRFIRDDVGIYLYYAGRDRKFMRISQIEERVFLDIPGFSTSEHTFSSDVAMIQALNRADAVKRYLKDRVNEPRARGLSEYPSSIPTVNGRVDRSFIADLGNVRTMFVDMKVGDIVVMTPSDHYERLLIGEIASEWNAEQTMMLPEQGENLLPYREVNWLSHTLTRRDFPAVVARRLQNRKAITRISDEFYDSIFRYLYQAYVWGNTSKLDIFGPQYNSNDPTATAEASFIIKYAVAYYVAYEKGEIDRFNDLSLEEAASEYFDPELVVQIAQAFGSPGGYVAKLIGPSAAVAVAMVIAVALSSESQSAQDAQHAVVGQAQNIQGARSHVEIDLPGLGNSMRAGNSEELRTKYGRAAKAKLGMTLEGERPPELMAGARIQREQ